MYVYGSSDTSYSISAVMSFPRLGIGDCKMSSMMVHCFKQCVHDHEDNMCCFGNNLITVHYEIGKFETSNVVWFPVDAPSVHLAQVCIFPSTIFQVL
jgi:hypothetical protein